MSDVQAEFLEWVLEWESEVPVPALEALLAVWRRRSLELEAAKAAERPAATALGLERPAAVAANTPAAPPSPTVTISAAPGSMPVITCGRS